MKRNTDNGLTYSEAQEITSQVVQLNAGWRQAIPAVGHAIKITERTFVLHSPCFKERKQR